MWCIICIKCSICENKRCYKLIWLISMYMNLYTWTTINMWCNPQIFEKLACHIVLYLLPFFIMACTLYTSQYRSKSKERNYYLCKHYLARQKKQHWFVKSQRNWNSCNKRRVKTVHSCMVSRRSLSLFGLGFGCF